MRIRTSVATTYSSSLLVKSCPPGHRSVAAEAGLFTMKIKQVEEPGMGEELKVHLHVRGKVFMTKEKLTPKQIPHQSFSVPCSFPFPQSGISISLAVLWGKLNSLWHLSKLQLHKNAFNSGHLSFKRVPFHFRYCQRKKGN